MKRILNKVGKQEHARSKRVIINERNAERKVRVVRVCQAPLDVDVDTPYLRFAAIAKKLVAERATCAFCVCGSCCPCDTREYAPRDAERAARRANMREFDARVRQDYQLMRIMYDP
ncbi:hypothetical protein MSG28_003825 [Choristoneura fumiferana]|uniref:Uncharacterized protein n=1 Tax=Choristoneura fumiferana TaxID=7141 RepID=A0ACC0KGB3_CHOFU|nr:hypothetical protein MSG28_003825 [Choristoneura fumiferana]